jgi:hypothetical protein
MLEDHERERLGGSYSDHSSLPQALQMSRQGTEKVLDGNYYLGLKEDQLEA